MVGMRGLLCLWPVLLLVSGCEKRFNPTEGRVTAIDANRGSLSKVEGALPDGTKYAAYFRQSDLQLVEETAGAVVRRFYYRGGSLFHFREEERRESGSVVTRFFIDEKGRLTQAGHVVNGGSKPPPREKVEEIVARAAWLEQDAARRAGPRIVLPLLKNR